MKSDYKIRVLGCRGSFPIFGKEFFEFGGSTTSYLISNGKHAIFVDCGTGLYNAKDYIKDCTKIDIYLSHMHYDHTLGLLSGNVFPKDADITFYGNFKKWFNKETLQDTFMVAPYWPIDINYGKFVQFDADGKIHTIENNIEVSCIPSTHPNDCSTYRFKIDGTTITFLCDCEEPNDEIREFVRNSDILFFDSMFDVDDYDIHKGWGHSTWKVGSELAKSLGIKHFYPTHHNISYSDKKLLKMEKQCKKEFANSIFAREGLVIKF